MQQGNYPLAGRTLAVSDTVTGVVTGATADIPLSALSTFIVANLSPVNITSGTISGVVITNSPISGSSGSFTSVSSSSGFSGSGSGLTGTAAGLSIGGNAATSTNITGGAVNQIHVQTATNTTGFIVAPTTANTTLTWSGAAFSWTPLSAASNPSLVNTIYLTTAQQNVTISIGTNAVVTYLANSTGQSGNTPKSGSPIVFSTTGALPSPLVAGTTYYVANSGGNASFLSFLQNSGIFITTTGTQSGTHTCNSPNYNLGTNSFVIVEAWSGGGRGGASGSGFFPGAGGGSGQYGRSKLLPAQISGPQSITIGTGGSTVLGTSAKPTNAMSSNVFLGGGGDASAATLTVASTPGDGGGTGSAPFAGSEAADLVINGNAGNFGVGGAASTGPTGRGGMTPFLNGGGSDKIGTNGRGREGLACTGGGGGGAQTGSTVGGDGACGQVIIYEYK